MRRTRIRQGADWTASRPRPSAPAKMPRGLLTALEALYGPTSCELGDAGIAERDQRHREAEAARTEQGCLPLRSA